MAKIPLRTYLQEVERLVDSQRIDEAVAHSRHILQFYPKFVDVYRVLGKAYLEAKRFGDAADIFQRVLSSIPEDFVSNAGMSIIREDEGNLDEAIWHMERAFEVEPSNSTIQDELRRLIGKRDGIEPPRIRLTRGALARMYMKGDLVQEAITEIRIALTEDATRLDLKSLLAVALYRVGQKVEAIEAANQVLLKLPYNMDANRIMSELLAGTERDEEAQEFRKNVVEMDPYYSFVTPSTPVAAQVPNQAVSLEKLDWQAPQQQIGPVEPPVFAVEPEGEAQDTLDQGEVAPEWLSVRQEIFGEQELPAQEQEIIASVAAGEPETFEPAAPGEISEPIQPAAQPHEEIPDWMLAAGWVPLSAALEAQEDTHEPEPVDQVTGEEELFAQTAPVWLEESVLESEPVPDPITDETSPEEALPEWVFEKEPSFSADNELPPWLADAGAEQPASVETGGTGQPGSAEGLPDWLFVEEPAAQEQTAAQPEIPAWLMEETTSQEPAAEIVEQPADSAAVQIPEWLFEEASLADQAPSESEGITPGETLAAVTGAAALKQALDDTRQPDIPAPVVDEPAILPSLEEALTQEPQAPEMPAEKPATTIKLPAWLLESSQALAASSAGEQSAMAAAAAAGEAGQPATSEQPAAEEAEIPAWLLEPSPDLAEPTAVDLSAAADFEPLVTELVAEGESAPASPRADEDEEIPAWLLEPSPDLEEPAAVGLSAAAVGEPEVAGEMQAEPTSTPSAEEETEIPAWLLAGALVDTDKQTAESIPQDEAVPDWLAMLEEPAPTEEDTQPRKLTRQAESDELVQASQPQPMAESQEERDSQPPAWLLAALALHDEDQAAPESGEESPAAGEPIQGSQPPTLSAEETVPAWLLAEELQPEALFEGSPTELNLPEEQSEKFEVESGSAAQPVTGETAPDGGPVDVPELTPETTLRAEIMSQELLEESEGSEEPIGSLDEIEEPALAEAAPADMPEWLVSPAEERASIFDWTPPPVAPTEYVDLNRATLVEIERLPGVGFIRAQNIINYRENNGPFTDLDELLKVPGITSDIIAGIKDYVYVEAAAAAASQASELLEAAPPAEVLPADLLSARAALEQDELEPALVDYAKLIENYQYLPEIIQDLKAAVERHPENPDLWLSLGDACIRSNQVQGALDAYRQAEKLLL